MGDVVAEWFKASVASRAVAGSILGFGWNFSLGRQLTDAWQKPTGTPLEILPNTTYTCKNPTIETLLPTIIKTPQSANGHSRRA